uniref:hypothetical chloroplast RF2 n=1 Tax=Lobelia zeylanica TaxID=1068521 RepID=UPI002551ECB0|nr:hypothetical chloroplast RF2 [Lobelia zeylanica]YP_010850278.1 hypothetical chloroplast RF2 [Lobelia zeylanica]WGH11666.1 hypothetical chloroplast RF2 [Lobelia zeylanica]WGH11667.1 hypothetical chloroplast RF2 [Lobelia zeylanica]
MEVTNMTIDLRFFIWELREVLREVKKSHSLLPFSNQVNSVAFVIQILFDQERFLKLLDPRVWIIAISRTRNSRGFSLPFKMKITRFFKVTIKNGILLVVAVLIYRMNNRNMVESKKVYLTGLFPTIPVHSIGPRDNTLAESIGSSHLNRFVLSLLYPPAKERGISDSESSFLNLKESTKKSSTNWGFKYVINWGLWWYRRWIIKKRLSSQVKESSNKESSNKESSNKESSNDEFEEFDEFLDSLSNEANEAFEWINQIEIQQRKERSILWDLSFEQAETEVGNQINDLLPEESEEVLGNQMNDLLPEESEEVLGNPPRPVLSFFNEGWSELHMGSNLTERSTRDRKLLKKQQDLSFVRRSEMKELVNLFKILMYLQNTVSIHPISSDPELEERFHEMADLFTLSITEPDLVYHKGFAFSIDSYGLDQKQFLFNSRDEWKNKYLLVLPPIFYEENQSFYLRMGKIGKDTLNHRTLMKYTINQHLSNLKNSQKRWFNPLILISPMNRDPDAYRYKWSTWIKNFPEHDPVGFDRLKIHLIEGWFEIIDELSKPLPFLLSERFHKFCFFLAKRLLKCFFSLFVSFRNTFFYRFAIYIYKSKGPNDHSCNPLLESIGLQIVYLPKLKPSLVDDPEPSQKLQSFINGGTRSPSLFNKIPKWSIDSFHTRKNRRKSFDNTDSSFSRIFHDQDNWLNPVKPFHRSSLISAFYKANRLRALNNPHDFGFDCNKIFPFYVEKARSKNYDFTYVQFLNTLFSRNKKFSLCVGKKKHAFWWRFWWRDTLSAIESQVSNIFIPDETDNLDKSFHFPSRSDPFVGRAIYSIADISGTPRTEGDVVNLERTYCQSRSDMNLSDSEGKNWHQSLNLNSNMALLHTLRSDKYLPDKKKPSLGNKLGLWLARENALAKQKQKQKQRSRKRDSATRKKWKLFKTYLPWAFTLTGYRYLQALLVQIVVEEFRRLKRKNKFVSITLNIGSYFIDIIKLSLKVAFKKERIKQIRFFLIKWKTKSARIRKIQRKIRQIQRKLNEIQRKCLQKILLFQDMRPRNHQSPWSSTHRREANLNEFFYSSIFFLFVTGGLLLGNLIVIFDLSSELQKEVKTIQMFLMASSMLEIEVGQLLDRYPLSESNPFWFVLTNLFLGDVHWKSKLAQIIDLISIPIDQLTFSINTRYLSHTSKEIYSVLKKRKKGEYFLDEKIDYWARKSDWVENQEKDVLIQLSTFTREKSIFQILWNLTDSDHFSKNEFHSQMMEQPGEIYLRNIIDLHNKDLLNYEFNKSCLAERRLFLALYHTIAYAETPSDANSADVQKPFSLRLASSPPSGILVIGCIGLGRSYLVKYLTKTSCVPLITIFPDKFRDTVFLFDDSEDIDEEADSDLDEPLFGEPREEIELINEALHVFDNMDIDDSRAKISFDMDPVEHMNEYINGELEQLTRSEELTVEMDTVWHVAPVYTSLQFELTKVLDPCIIWIPNIHELDFSDAAIFPIALLVNLLSWDCERSANRNSLVIASTHIPRQVQPSLIAPHRLDTCIHIRRPLIPQQQKHFLTLSYTRGFRLDKEAFQAHGFAAINMGYRAQDVEALTNEALSISIVQGKSIIDENTIRFARHRQTWDFRGHLIPVPNRLLFYQIGRAVAQNFLLSNCPIDTISIYLQKRLDNDGDSYLYRSYYELGMSMKKLTILLYLLNCSAGSVAQELWSPPEPNENNRIAYGTRVEDDFDLVHGLLEIEGILEGFAPDQERVLTIEKEIDKKHFDQQQKVEKEHFDQQQKVEKEHFDHQQKVEKEHFDHQQKVDKEHFDHQQLVDDYNFYQQQVDQKNFDQQQKVDRENFDQQQKVDRENFDQQQKVDREHFDQQQQVDKDNFDQQQNVDKENFDQQQKVDRENFDQQQKVDDHNFYQQQDVDRENFYHQQKVDRENFDQQQKVDRENLDQQENVDEDNLDHQQTVDRANFDQQQEVDEDNFYQQQDVDRENFYQQQKVEKEHFDHQQKVDKENFDQQQQVEQEHFDQQQQVEKEHFDQQQKVDKEHFDQQQVDQEHFYQQQQVDQEHFDQQQQVDQEHFYQQQKVDKEHFDQQQKVDKEHFDQQQQVDKENLDQRDGQQENVDQDNLDQQEKVDRDNLDQQEKVDQDNLDQQEKVDRDNLDQQEKVDQDNLDQRDGQQENVDQDNLDQQQQVDQDNLDQQENVDQDNFYQQQQVDQEHFDQQQKVDKEHFYRQQNVEREYFAQQQVDQEHFYQQQKVDKEHFYQQQKVDKENFDHQQKVEKEHFDHQQKVDKDHFDQQQAVKDRMPLLRRPEPRNPSAIIHNGFDSMIDQRFIYESEAVFIGGRKVDSQKVFSNFIAWAPIKWSPWSLLFDWVERVSDNELGFPYYSCLFWGKQMHIDIVRDLFEEPDQENDSDYDEDKEEPNPNPLDEKEQKKQRGLYYKLEDPADDGFERDDSELNEKFYEAFLRSVYQTRARIRSAKEQVLFRVSQFIWNPGNPFLVVSEDPALAPILSHREFFRDADDEVLKWFITSEIKSMRKSWIFEQSLETRFEWMSQRRRWLRTTNRSLSNASFRSHILSESYQYLSNLFLSNRTLLDQMKKTLVRKQWLFPDDMQNFFQNFFMEQYDTAETRKN